MPGAHELYSHARSVDPRLDDATPVGAYGLAVKYVNN